MSISTIKTDTTGKLIRAKATLELRRWQDSTEGQTLPAWFAELTEHYQEQLAAVLASPPSTDSEIAIARLRDLIAAMPLIEAKALELANYNNPPSPAPPHLIELEASQWTTGDPHDPATGVYTYELSLSCGCFIRATQDRTQPNDDGLAVISPCEMLFDIVETDSYILNPKRFTVASINKAARDDLLAEGHLAGVRETIAAPRRLTDEQLIAKAEAAEAWRQYQNEKSAPAQFRPTS